MFVCCIVVSRYYTGGYSPDKDSRYNLMSVWLHVHRCSMSDRLYTVCF